jgi:hypothetical protein
LGCCLSGQLPLRLNNDVIDLETHRLCCFCFTISKSCLTHCRLAASRGLWHRDIDIKTGSQRRHMEHHQDPSSNLKIRPPLYHLDQESTPPPHNPHKTPQVSDPAHSLRPRHVVVLLIAIEGQLNYHRSSGTQFLSAGGSPYALKTAERCSYLIFIFLPPTIPDNNSYNSTI